MKTIKVMMAVAVLFVCSLTACDFGTYSARVDDRMSELQNPNNDDGFEEGEEKIPDTKLFHAAYMQFYNEKGRAPSGWPEMLQYCNSFGQEGRKFAFACENFQKQGCKGNWEIEGGLDQATLDKRVILLKKDGKPRVFGNGQAVDF